MKLETQIKSPLLALERIKFLPFSTAPMAVIEKNNSFDETVSPPIKPILYFLLIFFISRKNICQKLLSKLSSI
jgi:hypothetical protein